MKKETIERVWGIYIISLVFIMFFGAGISHITSVEPHSSRGLDWVLLCLLFGMPPNILFLMFLTVFKKKE